jgi:hypothetical protein
MTPLLLAGLASLVQPDAIVVRAAVAKALVPLKAGAAGHVEKKTCFACHNQTYPTIAFAAAKARGFDVSTDVLKEQADHVTSFVTEHLEEYRSGKGTGGQADTAGAILWTLDLAGHKPDEATAAVVEYLLAAQSGKDHWSSSSTTRPPTEASSFTTTFVAVRGLKTWATAKQKSPAKARIEKAKGWLVKATPADTEDRVFRLMGLKEAGASAADVAAAAFELVNAQRPDGGWAQTRDMSSDPYATGTALVALHHAGGLKTDSAAYRAGVRFLLQTQRTDGTWLVKSRSKPFQPYYESGFPHGTDQFISSTATGWAATALALTLPAK